MSGSPRMAVDRRAAAQARRARRAEVTDAHVVMDAAAAFLAVRPRSVSETRRRLRHLGYAAGLVDEVTARLGELGYLDDVAFARWWVESRDRARPRGILALRQELLGKGVPREAVDEVLADRVARAADPDGGPRSEGMAGEGDEADLDAARRLLARRAAAIAREADPRRRRQRAYALLARQGFTPDVCRVVAATVVASDEPSDEGDPDAGARV